MKRVILVIALILAIVSIGSIQYIKSTIKAENPSLEIGLDQQIIIDDITSRLNEKGISVNSVKVVAETKATPPILVSFTIQSSSMRDQLAPADPIHLNMVGHEVNFAQLRGLNMGGVGVTIVNTQGVILLRDKKPVLDKAYLSTVVSKSSNMDIYALATVLSNVSTFGMTLDSVNIFPIENGAFKSKFKVNVADITEANAGVPDFLGNLQSKINELNNAGARIGIYEVEVSDSAGNTLLQYINDLEVGGRENWWQSEELTEVWYPHPNPTN